MVRALIVVVLLQLSLPIAGDSSVSREDLREYALKLVNRDRIEHNLRPLELDANASALADLRAREVLYDDNAVDDLPVYYRYSQAGIDDSLDENVHAWHVSYAFTGQALRELTRRSQMSMMDEQPPYDGRRAAILDPFATHAAFGFAWERNEFRIIQLFLRKYVHWAAPLPRCATTVQTAPAIGWPIGETAFDAITVHHEPPPTRRRKKKVARTTVMKYSLPGNRKEYFSKLGSTIKVGKDGVVTFVTFQYGRGRTGDVEVGPHGDFAFDIPFTEGPGVYTVVVWVRYLDRAEGFPASMTSIVVE